MSNETVSVYGVPLDKRRLACAYAKGFNWIAPEEDGHGVLAFISKPALSESRGMYDWTNMQEEGIFFDRIPNYNAAKMEPIEIDRVMNWVDISP